MLDSTLAEELEAEANINKSGFIWEKCRTAYLGKTIQTTRIQCTTTHTANGRVRSVEGNNMLDGNLWYNISGKNNKALLGSIIRRHCTIGGGSPIIFSLPLPHWRGNLMFYSGHLIIRGNRTVWNWDKWPEKMLISKNQGMPGNRFRKKDWKLHDKVFPGQFSSHAQVLCIF